jgi:hypothetical protein
MEIKELETSFIGRGQVKGFKFNQVAANDKAFIYRVDIESTNHYEVFERKVNSQYNNVSYPSDKAFGIWAFTTPSLDRATEIFINLTNK